MNNLLALNSGTRSPTEMTRISIVCSIILCTKLNVQCMHMFISDSFFFVVAAFIRMFELKIGWQMVNILPIKCYYFATFCAQRAHLT